MVFNDFCMVSLPRLSSYKRPKINEISINFGVKISRKINQNSVKKYSSIWGSILGRFESHLGLVWAPIWEDLAPLGELWRSQEPQIGWPRGTQIPLDPNFGAKRRFRSNLGWILDGFGSSDASQTGPRRALKPPRTCPKLSPESTQYSTFCCIQNNELPLTNYLITRPGGMGAAIK